MEKIRHNKRFRPLFRRDGFVRMPLFRRKEN